MTVATVTFITLHHPFLTVRIILTRYSRLERLCRSVTKNNAIEACAIACSETAAVNAAFDLYVLNTL